MQDPLPTAMSIVTTIEEPKFELVPQGLPRVIARVNADGTTYYDWPSIQEFAAKWKPFCTDTVICMAKLLAPFQPPATDASRPAHEQRVIAEKSELDTKLTKLREFFDYPAYAALPKPERDLLLRQESAMTSYSLALAERIAAFTPVA